jgi:preprotein translocase subunit SecA
MTMHFLTDDFRSTAIKNTPDILTGLNAALYKSMGRFRRRPSITAELLREAETIHGGAQQWREMESGALRASLRELCAVFRRRGKEQTLHLPKALGAIMEAAYRTLGIRPYAVQTAGALGLYKGYVIEMGTGEGKTLTAALTAVLRGWSGYPCHIITANDYLAQRDAEKLSPLYAFCGVTVGSVAGAMQPPDRRAGYANDITYSTAKEITADFLRDRLALGPLQKFERRQIQALMGRKADAAGGIVTRGMHTAIVDEADSLLIDEAVTPLIISRGQPNEPFVKACMAASAVAATLKPGEQYTVNFQYKEVELPPEAEFRAALAAGGIPKQFSGSGFQRELIRQALTAKEFYHRDKQYVVQDDKIVIVDEFTGRTMAQRSWSEGLHQMVEAKEHLPITPPNETLARLSFQRYFRFYQNLSGMTGTARESAPELWHIYGLPVIPIPPNKPCQRIVLPRKFFIDQESKLRAVVDEIAAMHAQGRPVLVGTRSVYRSEELASRLAEKGLPCKVINAVRHREEAAIIAEAGKQGAITVATNMAGRGTDILLDRQCESKGGLHVIAAECNESGRIDRQLFGRCARQGDKGSARLFVSMDDELLRRFLPPAVLKTATEVLRTNRAMARWMADRAVRLAQNTAQRRAYRSRRAVQKMDTWLKDSLSFAQSEF